MSANASLLDRGLLVVDQKRKFFEMRNQYRIFDETGETAGAIEQVSQHWFTFIARLGTDLDVALPVTLEVQEPDGSTVLVLHKPWFRMRLDVKRSDGTPVGSIRKKIRLGKAQFVLSDPAGMDLGVVQATNWRARNFTITDLNQQTVAQVDKKWKGLVTEMFSDADKYAIRMETSCQEPLRSLALSAALAIDLVMKQKDS